jgi:hypothetical protein
MRKMFLRRPSPAMIIAIVALIAALSGTAVAAGFLPKAKFANFKKNVAVKGPITYVNNTQSVNTTSSSTGQNITAACPSGFFPVGGGAKTNNNSNNTTFVAQNSYPSATGWTALVFAGTGPTAESVTVTAICERAKTSGTPPSITG